MLRFWVWSHYWPQTSQLHATFANWHRAMKHAEEELVEGFTVVDTQGQMKPQHKSRSQDDSRSNDTSRK